jgi:hypothetical protein
MTREKWCVEFVNQLIVNASPPVPIKVARAIALTEHVTHSEVDPLIAAREWMETRHPGPPSTPRGARQAVMMLGNLGPATTRRET